MPLPNTAVRNSVKDISLPHPTVESQSVAESGRKPPLLPSPEEAKAPAQVETAVLVHVQSRNHDESLMMDSIRSGRAKKESGTDAAERSTVKRSRRADGLRTSSFDPRAVTPKEKDQAEAEDEEEKTKEPLVREPTREAILATPTAARTTECTAKPGPAKSGKQIRIEVIEGPERLLGKTLEISSAGLVDAIHKQEEGTVYFGNTDSKPALVPLFARSGRNWRTISHCPSPRAASVAGTSKYFTPARTRRS